MSWVEKHRRSEELASDAEHAWRQQDFRRAYVLYQAAASAEEEALAALPADKSRTFGITAISAVALWYKSRELRRAEELGYRVMATGRLPGFAVSQLRTVLQSVWNEMQISKSGLRFAPGQVLVAIKGGDVVHGGAPIDLVVDKVQTVQSIFYRTVELLKEMPLRRSGPPSREIQEACRPWLFQAVPGSYQFSVMVEEPKQADFFKESLSPRVVADTFLSILSANIQGDETQLQSIVKDETYRKVFRKLTRNLAPSERTKTFEVIELRNVIDGHPLVLSFETRREINAQIRHSEPATIGVVSGEIRGVLRAVHLEEDWLEVMDDDGSKTVRSVGEAVDDVIGPMVNHRVIVHVGINSRNQYSFRDIELEA